MRQLRPNSRGVLQHHAKGIRHAGQLVPYTKTNNILPRLDRLINGEKPRICITRKQGGIGDVLMTTPVVKTIATKYGILVDYGTDFHYLEGALQKVLMYNPYINKILPWTEVDKDDYDAVIDLTCPCVAHEKPGAQPINRIDLFARYIKLQLIDTQIDYVITDEEKEWAVQYKKEHGFLNKVLILVQPFASASARCSPVELLKKSLFKITQANQQIVPVIITHDSDIENTDWNNLGFHVFNNYDIRHIAAIMTQCSLVVCPDSAILHLAAAFRHKTFTLFGPTDPYARVNYHPEAVAYWPGKELVNYPCWYQVPPDKYLCWKRMEESVIVKSIVAMLNDDPLPNCRNFVTFGEHTIENQHYEIV